MGPLKNPLATGQVACEQCCEGTPPLVVSGNFRHCQHAALGNPVPPTTSLRPTRTVYQGEVLLRLRTSQTPAAWPSSDCGALGKPATDTAAPQNCAWLTERCSRCGFHQLWLIATDTITPADILRGPAPPATLTPCRLWMVNIAFPSTGEQEGKTGTYDSTTAAEWLGRVRCCGDRLGKTGPAHASLKQQ